MPSISRSRADSPVLQIAVLTILLEVIALLFRFVFDLQATRDTASWISPLTFGVRIHHGYIGVLLLLIGFRLLRSESRLRQPILVSGAALLLSDLIHHFIFLHLITGDSQFDLVYPEIGMTP